MSIQVLENRRKVERWKTEPEEHGATLDLYLAWASSHHETLLTSREASRRIQLIGGLSKDCSRMSAASSSLPYADGMTWLRGSGLSTPESDQTRGLVTVRIFVKSPEAW